ncbi:MAG: ABC-type transport auxiliary lipoprotein family protein [Arcobacter sp.]|uniref:ABC-type transport auxiliary lipoprotein family protein n=1 Tax=Arcobacter sp. TaxID=1872629 RepID=UPI003B003B35
MRTNMKILFFILIGVLFTACSFKQNSFEINRYAIDFKSNINTFESSSESIYIEAPDMNKSFNTNSILYTLKPHLFEEYAKNRWINLPSNMIHNYLVEAVESSNLYKVALQKRSNIAYDYTLKTNVLNLYHEVQDTNSYAVLKIRFDLVSNKKLLKTYRYDKKVLCETTNAYGFVIAINKAFDELSSDLLVQLSKELE